MGKQKLNTQRAPGETKQHTWDFKKPYLKVHKSRKPVNARLLISKGELMYICDIYLCELCTLSTLIFK